MGGGKARSKPGNLGKGTSFNKEGRGSLTEKKKADWDTYN